MNFKLNTQLLSVCLLISTMLSTSLLGADWTQYRGINGDGKSPETIPQVNWAAKPPKVLWKKPTPLGFSSISIAGGRAFTLISEEDKAGTLLETCVAFDADTGEKLWSVPLKASDYDHDGGNAGAPDNRGGDGPRSTPTTDGKLVFVYDAHMVLSCLNAASGELVWQHDVMDEYEGREIKWFNATSPLMNGDTIYVGGGGAGSSFLAFNKNSGKLLWKSGDETITHATPTFTEIDGKPQVIFFVQFGLVSVSANDGKELWRTKFAFSVSTAASPVVSGNDVYCSAGYGVGSLLVQVNNTVEPDETWYKAGKLMNHWSTPLVHDGHLYGIFEFKKWGKAPLQCVELSTGEIKWSERNFGPGNCILVGDKLVVLSDTGEVVLAAASPDSYQELGRTKAVTGKCWSTPAYSNGKIYVRSTEEAACLEVE